MAIFENFDQTSWILFGLLMAAVVGYYLWPEVTKAQAEVHRDEVTRKKAKSLIALANDGADDLLFELSHTPLRVQAGPKLKAAIETGQKLDTLEVREALWTQQRAMITRLENELDYAQQADVSEHFSIAAPANQPASLLEKTLKELDDMNGKIRAILGVKPEQPLWHGRAMVLMMSNRKLFDHVAWLTGAGLASSAAGAFTLFTDDIVMITIYATRLGGFARPLTTQVARAAIRGTGGDSTPKWVEYGLAHWVADKMVGKLQLAKDEQAPVWSPAGEAIFDPAAWEKAADDSTKLEALVVFSGIFVDAIMEKSPDRIASHLTDLRTAAPEKQVTAFAWAKDASLELTAA